MEVHHGEVLEHELPRMSEQEAHHYQVSLFRVALAAEHPQEGYSYSGRKTARADFPEAFRRVFCRPAKFVLDCFDSRLLCRTQKQPY